MGLLLSIIIPIGPDDAAYRVFASHLLQTPILENIELIFSATVPPPLDLDQLVSRQIKIRWITGTKGRAEQMNRGAKAAMGEKLWFLHADSHFENPQIVQRVLEQIDKKDNSFFYFDLHFLADGPDLMFLNRLGVWIRSHILGLPFGDQAFLISRQLFWCLGGFREDVAYGEDHLLVWAARHAGLPIRPIGYYVSTSARRYKLHGWRKTTLKHMWLTFLQAMPLAMALICKKRMKKGEQL